MVKHSRSMPSVAVSVTKGSLGGNRFSHFRQKWFRRDAAGGRRNRQWRSGSIDRLMGLLGQMIFSQNEQKASGKDEQASFSSTVMQAEGLQ